MIMKKIICHIDLWDIYQHPILLENGQIKELPECPLDELHTALVEYCKEYNTNQVALYGARMYNDKLANDIYAYNATQYGLNNLEVEVV